MKIKKIAMLFLTLTVVVLAKTAPDFTAKDINGKTWSLDSLIAGHKLTIVSFWSTSCSPCKQELVLLDSLYAVYGKKGLNVVAVNVDSKRTISRVAPMVKSYKWDFTVLLDPSGKLMRLFKVSPIPHSFYILPDKTVLKSVIGYTKKDASEIVKTIKSQVYSKKNKDK